ncbi:MAG TPA: hypothetical protein ENN31_02130 [Candidatus Vogelbacteria bacterium]|nr:hypothetical protein [Candidatus Vogelbacteria bacterium]
MSVEDFIKKHPHLIWWTTDFEQITPEAVVEATLNYGDWDEVQELFTILSREKVAEIFRRKSKISTLGRQNYLPEIKNYFNLYFDKYVPGSTK